MSKSLLALYEGSPVDSSCPVTSGNVFQARHISQLYIPSGGLQADDIVDVRATCEVTNDVAPGAGINIGVFHSLTITNQMPFYDTVLIDTTLHPQPSVGFFIQPDFGDDLNEVGHHRLRSISRYWRVPTPCPFIGGSAWITFRVYSQSTDWAKATAPLTINQGYGGMDVAVFR